MDFVPLSVDYQERFSSVGATSGGYNKRDGRPGEKEILTSRIIDRPLRPLVDSRWRHETQLLSWVLSFDGKKSTEAMAICASSAALYLSDVPIETPVSGVEVGYIEVDGSMQFVVNPTNEQREVSKLHLTVAGTERAVLMIEGSADFLTESEMIEAIQVAHKEIKNICRAMVEFRKIAGRESYRDSLVTPSEGITTRVKELMTDDVNDAYSSVDKSDQVYKIDRAYEKVVEVLETEFPAEEGAIKGALKDLFSSRMYELAKVESRRVDGRGMDQVRPIDVLTGFLPRVHGSALFTRGETQAIATTTLGDKGMAQKVDTIEGLNNKRFYLQYTFPPSCVGETGRVGAPGRREVGHGNLAERALQPIIPDESEFPYTIRTESLITESHGSSSMASVCGGCLSMMDAGVPVKRVVAGVAMGALMEDKKDDIDNAIVLTDLMGIEDALGMMDFKIAGDKEGISTFQLDTKCEGLSVGFMKKALEQARVARLHIIDKMEEMGGGVRDEMPDTVPKVREFKIDADGIGKVRQSEERSDELARPYLVTKTARARTSVQVTPPP